MTKNAAPPKPTADDDKKQQKWFNITLSAKPNHADIYLYGVIGSWELNVQTFMDELAQYKKLSSIDVYISTLGGTFMDGLPIYNTLKQHKAFISTINMGYAFSMGSHIMLAGDKRKSAQNAMQMLHEANTFTWGSYNSADLRHLIKVLDVHTAAMLPRYQEILALSKSKVQAILAEETYYSADQALKAGLIDEIIDPAEIDDEALEAASDKALTEDHWREIIQFAGKQPPEAVQNYLCSKVPEAKAHFAALKQQADLAKSKADKIHNEDDDMTPEQMQAFQDSMKTVITTAISEGIKTGMESTATAFADEIKPLLDAQTQVISDTAKAAKDQTDTVIQGLKDQAEKIDQHQEKQTTSINDVTTALNVIKKLPVNNQNIDDHGGASDNWNDPDNRPYS